MAQFTFARKLLAAALIATGALAAAAIPRTSSASVDVHVQYRPPAPRVEMYPAVRQGYVWVPGYWDWRGHRQIWVEGLWARERHHHHYPANRWEGRDYGRYRDGGRWDRDGDGTPDRYDRHPYHPYRP